MKKKEGFHTPFEILKGINIASPKKKSVPPKKPELQDEDVFRSAMQGVIPITSDMAEFQPKPPVVRKTPQPDREDQIALEKLNRLVEGTVRFDITLTGEYVEGYVKSTDPGLVSMLKEGRFAVQDHIDLHGLTTDEARPYIEGFIHKAYMNGLRTLLIIHGRGLKSEAEPVLKNSVIRWITSGQISHKVLAFCSARSCDGGTGALYVLLKAKAKKAKWVKKS